jgi:riboflavin synthase
MRLSPSCYALSIKDSHHDMFTGLIEEVGFVRAIRATERGTQLQVKAPRIAREAHEGESIAVNGCCLSVTSVRGDDITFDLLRETLARTNLRELGAKSTVNLERALVATARLGGHFVQGHVDCTTPVLRFETRSSDHRLEVKLPKTFARYAAFKGSIALNGVSLTIAELFPKSLVVWIIPQTLQETNLSALRPGDLLNAEFDLLAKYVERALGKVSRRKPHSADHRKATATDRLD